MDQMVRNGGDAKVGAGGIGQGTINSFRRKRGRLLAQMIQGLARGLGRPVNILDVGGRAEYWENVGYDGIAGITVLNYDAEELTMHRATGARQGFFHYAIGDARAMPDYADGAVDLVHSNSVIEHVGAWNDMAAMAQEMKRIGKAGWVQTPAWEFPLEPHFRVPFMHWFGAPLRRKFLRFSTYKDQSLDLRRSHVDRINLLSRAEVRSLFPGCEIMTERVMMLPKSYVVKWGAIA